MRPTTLLLCGLMFVTSACQSPTPPAESAASPTPLAGAFPDHPSPTPATVAEKAAENLIETPSGLKYQDLVVGNGPRPLFGQTVRLRYTGWTVDGIKFDSNQDGAKPALELKLGKGEVIKGWEIGVGGGRGIEAMRVGGKRKLVIPPALGYGSNPMGTIPPNSTLVFEVELIGIKGNNAFGMR
ncbi:MAG: FKBP-type peptidyl-prolyl cis-trans isomerase [Acidobacteria bacterium]|nr:FKBP-type peptidyl-prolyl cis-trans isomerase [Acidobacteriota bacterium]MBI3422298.1 FKBP-type peptidyl-prolyl cis-trans isomerase [Acidobacteriota bacterium]